jgi:hypothetical protein
MDLSPALTARRPFALPGDLPQPDPMRDYFRGTLCALLANNGSKSAAEIARDLFSHRGNLEAITRAAVNPATLTTAAPFVGTSVASFLRSLAPRSAASQLFQLGLTVPLDGVGSIVLPRGLGPSAPLPVFIDETGAIPVVQGLVSSVQLGPPKKLSFIAVVTAELERLAAEAATAILRDAMTSATERALDAAVFSDVAASSSRPAGILTTPAIAATTGGGLNAVVGDMEALTAALVAAGSGAEIVFVMNPVQIVVLRALAPGLADLRIIPSAAIPLGTVIAVDPGAVASGFSGPPRIDLSTNALVHMEGATPLPIGTPGSPNVIAAPTRSLWQTDCIGMRCILPCAWVTRLPGGAQWIQAVSW